MTAAGVRKENYFAPCAGCARPAERDPAEGRNVVREASKTGQPTTSSRQNRACWGPRARAAVSRRELPEGKALIQVREREDMRGESGGGQKIEEGKKAAKKRESKIKEARRRAVAVMCPKVGKIAKTLAELAEQGNCQAAKLVFEFLGIFPAPHSTEEEGDDTLARYLLRELGIDDHPSEAEITNVLNRGGEANAGTVQSS